MNLNEYQAAMVKIWESDKSPDEELLFCCIGMAEEAGEAMGKIKRWMRGEGFDREGYLKELGDVLAYLVVAHDAWMKLNVSNQENTLNILGKALIKPCNFLKANIMLYQESGWVLDKIENKEYQSFLPYLADVMYEIRRCLSVPEVRSNLEEVMQLNLQKLADRKARNGTLRGTGDNR